LEADRRTRDLHRQDQVPREPRQHYQIALYDIAHAFLPGHRIRVEISSSYAPTFNPNQNTCNPVATDTEWRVAKQSIFHNASAASYIELPVMAKP
jgi:uncharacterized protein